MWDPGNHIPIGLRGLLQTELFFSFFFFTRACHWSLLILWWMNSPHVLPHSALHLDTSFHHIGYAFLMVSFLYILYFKRLILSVFLVGERIIPTERLPSNLVPTFADRLCRVFSATDPHGRILWFLDRSRYYFFQVASQLYSRGWMDPVPDPLLLRKSGSARNRTRTSGSAARNSDH
jgi:hypothetical protein